MEPPANSDIPIQTAPHKKPLPGKKPFGKYPKSVDSPAYDASEEDNDPLTDDGGSAISIPLVSRLGNPPANRPKPTRPKHQLAASFLSDSDGVDSPTYDGDIESSTTAGPDSLRPSHHYHTSSVSTLNTPSTPAFPSSSTGTPSLEPENVIRHRSNRQEVSSTSEPLHIPEEPSVPQPAQQAFNPASLTPEDIQEFVRKAIEGESFRKYKINEPPQDRPVRIYADGVYDLFHFGHALQLRQAKLCFPSVYLLVGVNSDELVWTNKARTIMTHAERLEAVRHCRWVDEVVAEAPWIIDRAFLDKYHIDYVAHDEDPYAAVGHDDVYALAKNQGKFIPTRRTPGVSTSELLERIVSGYRKRDFDDKLTKMGHAELCAEGSDYDYLSSKNPSRSMSPSPIKAPPVQ